MKYICAQPATQYFGWQIDILVSSLISTGVFQKDIHVINSSSVGVDEYFNKLKTKYPYVLFEFYEDTRKYKNYIPSIKQHLLYKHYSKHTYLENETILLLDADVAFIRQNRKAQEDAMAALEAINSGADSAQKLANAGLEDDSALKRIAEGAGV